MNIYILKPREDLPKENPWKPWYDACFGMVVIAGSEAEAREIAKNDAHAEGGDAWEDASLSTCEILSRGGDARVVLQDVWEA